MDSCKGTLHRLLQSLDENNVCLGWNMYRNKNGRIIVKISYDDDSTLDLNSDCDSSHQNVSYRRKSSKEIKRNQQRAQEFRDNVQPLKRPRHFSPEIARLDLQISSPIHNIDVSHCEEEVNCLESSARDLSASSDYFEMEAAKPVIEKKLLPSVMPESPKKVTPDKPKSFSKPPDPSHRKSSVEHSSKSYSKNSDSNSKDKKDIQYAEKQYCTIGWCAIGKVHTGCTCTNEKNPCLYCLDERLLKSKVCRKCKDDF